MRLRTMRSVDTYRLWRAREELEQLRMLVEDQPGNTEVEGIRRFLCHFERAVLEAESIAGLTGSTQPATMPWREKWQHKQARGSE
jgi:hypothetical protein